MTYFKMKRLKSYQNNVRWTCGAGDIMGIISGMVVSERWL
jgi:hypothetical protein